MLVLKLYSSIETSLPTDLHREQWTELFAHEAGSLMLIAIENDGAVELCSIRIWRSRDDASFYTNLAKHTLLCDENSDVSFSACFE